MTAPDRAREIAERFAREVGIRNGREGRIADENAIISACHEYAAPIERERESLRAMLALKLCNDALATDAAFATEYDELRAKLARVEAVLKHGRTMVNDLSNLNLSPNAALATDAMVRRLEAALTGDERKDG